MPLLALGRHVARHSKTVEPIVAVCGLGIINSYVLTSFSYRFIAFIRYAYRDLRSLVFNMTCMDAGSMIPLRR